jgi:bifunctional isochorismate lyase/aryl carrier protein
MGLPGIQPYELPVEGDFPAPRVDWKLDASRAALLIHDMQNYFVNVFTPDSSPITPVVANIVAIRERCRALNIPVYYTAQIGNQDPRDRGLQRHFWGPGMKSLPEHQPIIDALEPSADERVLEKWRYSAFQRTNLETLMQSRRRDQLIITGVYAHIGCMMSAADAFMRDIEPFFVADAVADFSRDKHDLAVSYVAERCGVSLTTQHVMASL